MGHFLVLPGRYQWPIFSGGPAIFEARYLKNGVPNQKSASKRFFQPIKIKIPTFCFLPISTHLKALGIYTSPKSWISPQDPIFQPITTVCQIPSNGRNFLENGRIWANKSSETFRNTIPFFP